jgi:hypothetical protein
LRGECGLRHPQSLSCPPEATYVTNRLKVLKLP